MAQKMIKSSPLAPAGVSIGNETARMHGSEDKYIQIDSKGTFISGKVSFMSTMSEVRTGAMWTFNNNFAMMIPSTLGTPSATLMVDPPIKNIQNIVEEASLMMGMYGMIAAGSVG